MHLIVHWYYKEKFDAHPAQFCKCHNGQQAANTGPVSAATKRSAITLRTGIFPLIFISGQTAITIVASQERAQAIGQKDVLHIEFIYERGEKFELTSISGRCNWQHLKNVLTVKADSSQDVLHV